MLVSNKKKRSISLYYYIMCCIFSVAVCRSLKVFHTFQATTHIRYQSMNSLAFPLSFLILMFTMFGCSMLCLFHFQEKKTPLSRTSSIENALISIDSAFDFLSEHQTMKPDKKTESINKEICASSWKILKKVRDL